MDTTQLIANSYMYNLYAIFAKYLDICKLFAGNLVNTKGNMPRYGGLWISDLEVVVLGMASESIGIQFMIERNYEKDTEGLFTRIIGKISVLTILQYINYKNQKPIGRIKYALI